MLKRARWLPPEVRAELAENGCIHRNARGFAMRFACKPRDHGLIYTPLPTFHLGFSQEPVELQKGEPGPRIAVPQVPFEKKKIP
jgi:hypothetical protein